MNRETVETKTLFILRHAKSSWAHENLSDHDRPLNARGEDDAPRIGAFMQLRGLYPELILTSTARRARRTTSLVVQHGGLGRRIRQTRDLYHADAEEIIELLRTVSDDYVRVMVVGHNPGLEGLVEVLTGDWERLPTGALVQIALPITRWGELGDETEGELLHLWTPRELK